MIRHDVHLSPAEHEVARSVVRGENPTAAAQRLRIPVSRYRALLHSIERKTGAGSHHEMIELLIGANRRRDAN